MGYETVLDALEADGRVMHGYGRDTDVAFRCPAHDDRVASGSLKESGRDGSALVYCHAGCEVEDIVEALGLEMKDLFAGEKEVEAYYEYEDEEERPLFRVIRFRPKGFTQEHWDPVVQEYRPGLNGVRRVLYHLVEVCRPETQTVYVVEGEKDADRLRDLGFVGTCNPGGASSWRPEFAESLRGKDVIIIPDNDKPGEKHARAIQASLDGVAASVKIKYAARGKDVSNHLDAGLSLSELTDEPSPEEAFEPLDWETYESPDVQWLMEPYFPTRGRVLVYGKAGSLKSLWVMWVATRLAREGKKVAYFSLEMRPEQTVARLKKLNPPRDNFKVYTNYQLGDSEFLQRTVDALRGFDMIVVDSFNAAYRFSKGTHDDQFAELDDNFFQPIIDGTGATLVLLDNTGHDLIVGFGNKVASQHPRGTSAKVDKVDVAIWLNRPNEDNNYVTEIHVKKMRYDLPIPSKRVVVAPSGHEGIEFYYCADTLSSVPGDSMWEKEMMPGGEHTVESERNMERGLHTDIQHDEPELWTGDPLAGLNVEEKLAYIRAQRLLEPLKYADVPGGDDAAEAGGSGEKA